MFRQTSFAVVVLCLSHIMQVMNGKKKKKKKRGPKQGLLLGKEIFGATRKQFSIPASVHFAPPVWAGGNMGEGGEFLSLPIVPGTTVSSFRTHKHLPHMVPDPPPAAPDCLSPTVERNAAPFTPHLFSHGGEKQTSHFWRKFDTPHPPRLPPFKNCFFQ